MFSVIPYEEGTALPISGTYYVLASNGIFLFKDRGIVKGLVPVEKISFLDPLQAGLVYNLPLIPPKFVWQLKYFFAKTVSKFRAESIALLWYSQEEEMYRLEIPEQKVSHGSIRYRRVAKSQTEGMEKYVRLGTIHSHCDFQAYHSSVDEGDEEFFDGLHITFGHNNMQDFTLSSTVVMNGYRHEIDSMYVLDGIRISGTIDHRELKHRRYRLNVEPEAGWLEEAEQWMETLRTGGPDKWW